MSKFRDDLEQSQITDDDYRRWYQEDHRRIGSFWTLHYGGSFFRPSFKYGEGWRMVHRDGDHVVLENPDGRARLDRQHRVCFDAGFEGNLILAHDIRPKLAYRLDQELMAFVHDPERGTIFIEGSYPNFKVMNDGMPVHIGADFNFYFQEQPDILHAAKAGRMGSLLDEMIRPDRPKATLRLCQNCGVGVIDHAAPKSQIFCSVACGHRVVASNPDPVRKYTCANCGGEFKRKGSGNYKYCSAVCHDEAVEKAKPKRSAYECIQCHTHFYAHGSGHHKFCSDKCRKQKRADDRLKNKIMGPKERTAKCDHCGTWFKYQGRGPARRYCSNFCKTMG